MLNVWRAHSSLGNKNISPEWQHAGKNYQERIVREVARQLSCGGKGNFSVDYNYSVVTGAIP